MKKNAIALKSFDCHKVEKEFDIMTKVFYCKKEEQ